MNKTERTKWLKDVYDEAVAARMAYPELRFNPVIAAAQAALESNWGRSQLAVRANNIKGMKVSRDWQGKRIQLPTREQRPDGTIYETVADWKVYPSVQEAFRDYGALIERVYPQSAAVAEVPLAFLEGLTSGALKYATDLQYTSKVWSIVEQYGMLTWGDVYGLTEEEFLYNGYIIRLYGTPNEFGDMVIRNSRKHKTLHIRWE